MLRRLNEDRGVTFVIVTHDAGVAGSTDRVVRLRDGQVVADVARGAPGWREALGPAAGNGAPGVVEGRVFARLGAMLNRVRPGASGR
jgi:energy-coupling factor transporter ATP-binding protein EcfA2